MLRYIQHLDIDKKKWNEAINNSTTPFPYLYSWYLDIACKNWDAIVDEEYNNIFPIAFNKKSGIEYIYQPFFTQQFGLIKKSNGSEDQLNECINIISKKYSFIETQLNYTNHIIDKEIQFKTRKTHHINLIKSYDEIKLNYNNNLTRKIKKAQQENFEIRLLKDPNIIIQEFITNKGIEVRVLKKADYSRLEVLIDTAIKLNHGKIVAIYKNNIFQAATFLLYSHKFIINLFPVSSNEGRKSNSMAFLIDHILKEESESNKIFDFEGSDIESIANFYKSFGAEQVNYLKLIINNLPWHARIIKKIKDGL